MKTKGKGSGKAVGGQKMSSPSKKLNYSGIFRLLIDLEDFPPRGKGISEKILSRRTISSYPDFKRTFWVQC